MLKSAMSTEKYTPPAPGQLLTDNAAKAKATELLDRYFLTGPGVRAILFEGTWHLTKDQPYRYSGDANPNLDSL